MSTFKITAVMVHYENILVGVEGKPEWVYLSPDMLIGLKIKGEMVLKRTRTWIEKPKKKEK